MIDRLKDLLRSDDFIPTSSVFPEIDADKIRRELRLAEQAKSRGKSDLPPAAQVGMDSVEMEILSRVEDARRRGLDNYENNRNVYSRRLRTAHTARSEIDTIAGTARGNFAKEVKSYRSDMARIEEDVEKWNEALRRYQERHALDRPAYDRAGVIKTLVIVATFFIVETGLNGALFAGKNELGYAGGGFIAALISLVNVGVAGLSGTFARYAQYRFLIGRLLGYAVIAAWIAGSLVLNLAVAHFRDAVETLEAWQVATQASVDTLIATPFELASMESWLLMAWGLLISTITFLKFLLSGETYPGYARISERRLKAVERFENILADALDSLEKRRDKAIEDLKEANGLVREQIGDAIDALYGRRMMHGHLQAFLDQCDMKATTLLKYYRDQNRAARSSEPPGHFDEDHRFPEFKDDVNSGDGNQHRLDAESKVEAVEQVVDETIAAIHEQYRAALDAYANTGDLIAGKANAARRAPPGGAPTVVSSNVASSERVA